MNPQAYILVGGRSARFEGGEKPLARFGGKTLAENALGIAQTALPGSKICFVARDAGQFVDESERLDVEMIPDRFEGRGPLGGLFAALADCESEWLFLFACDMPLMAPDVIRNLRSHCERRFGVVLPRQQDGRLQPLCAFYNVAETLPVVEALIHRPDGNASMMSAIDALEARIGEPAEIGAEPSVWANVNTAADLAEIERKLSGKGEI